jgi:signal peptidase I
MGLIKRVGLLALAVGCWLLLVPTQLGGAASYVRVQGNSMYPTLRTGDTVLLIRDDRYVVGDIVAFRSKQLGGAVVIHRIVDVAPDGRFVTQGDNNDFVDGDRLSDADVLGKRTLRLPGGEQVVATLSGPLRVAILAGGLWLLLFFRPGGAPSVHRRRAMRRRHS